MQSKSQLRYFFSAEARGELAKGMARQWAAETPNLKKLPERKKKKKKEASVALPVNYEQNVQKSMNTIKPMGQLSGLRSLMTTPINTKQASPSDKAQNLLHAAAVLSGGTLGGAAGAGLGYLGAKENAQDTSEEAARRKRRAALLGGLGGVLGGGILGSAGHSATKELGDPALREGFDNNVREALEQFKSYLRPKQANVFSDTRNVLWGENNTGRLKSWNNIKGYLPSSLRNHITNKHVNPAIHKALRHAGKAGLGLLGSGLLGLFMLYKGLTAPKKPTNPEQPTRNFEASSMRPLSTVNENLGLGLLGYPSQK